MTQSNNRQNLSIDDQRNSLDIFDDKGRLARGSQSCRFSPKKITINQGLKKFSALFHFNRQSVGSTPARIKFMATFVVTSAAYNGSYPAWPKNSSNSDDPLVFVQGKLNGVYCNAWFFWSQIQRANAFGVGAVQQLIGTGFLNYSRGVSPALPLPAFPIVNFPPPVTGGPISVNCQEALNAGTWTA